MADEVDSWSAQEAVHAGCHGFGVLDKAVRFRRNVVVGYDSHEGMNWRIAPFNERRHGLVEDSKTVAPRIQVLLLDSPCHHQ